MILTNPFTHDPRVYNEAKSLVDNGHKVTVFAWDKIKKNPEKEAKDGINIFRSCNSKFMNILPYDIFQLHWWWRKGYKDALKLFEDKHFDVVHCHDLSSLPIGIKLKNKFGLKLVYDAHEIWGYMVEKGVPWWRYYLWKEIKLLKSIDHMIVTNDARREFYKDKVNCQISIIDNYKHVVSKKYIKPPNYDEKKLIILYIGSFIHKRFLLELIDVIGTIDNVLLRIGGKGELYREIEEKTKLFENVEFLGTVPSEEVIQYNLDSDVVFCMIAPHDKNDITASTNKQFEAMVSGRPIICTKGTFSGEFTEKYNIGLTSKYDENDLKETILKLKNNPDLRQNLGENALKQALNEFNWKKQENELLKVYIKKYNNEELSNL